MANDVIPVSPLLPTLMDDPKLPQPFAQEIFLQECHVAGTSHVKDVVEKTTALEVGALLSLRRDPANKYDGLAISILMADGTHIGWVPQKYNKPYAHLMDAGKLLFAKLVHKELDGRYLDLRVQIILRDF